MKNNVRSDEDINNIDESKISSYKSSSPSNIESIESIDKKYNFKESQSKLKHIVVKKEHNEKNDKNVMVNQKLKKEKTISDLNINSPNEDNVSNNQRLVETEKIENILSRPETFTIKKTGQKSFFTTTITHKLKENDPKHSYCNYLVTLFFCKTKEREIYDLRIKALTDLLNIHTYCRLTVLQKDYSNMLN